MGSIPEVPKGLQTFVTLINVAKWSFTGVVPFCTPKSNFFSPSFRGWMRVLHGEGNGNPLQYSCLSMENPHGQRSLAGSSPWGHEESDTIGQLTLGVL